jgi:hypothetical protein
VILNRLADYGTPPIRGGSVRRRGEELSQDCNLLFEPTGKLNGACALLAPGTVNPENDETRFEISTSQPILYQRTIAL